MINFQKYRSSITKVDIPDSVGFANNGPSLRNSFSGHIYLTEAQSIKFRILLKEEQTAGELLINIE